MRHLSRPAYLLCETIAADVRTIWFGWNDADLKRPFGEPLAKGMLKEIRLKDRVDGLDQAATESLSCHSRWSDCPA
jgi:hypothetical protein